MIGSTSLTLRDDFIMNIALYGVTGSFEALNGYRVCLVATFLNYCITFFLPYSTSCCLRHSGTNKRAKRTNKNMEKKISQTRSTMGIVAGKTILKGIL